MGINHFWESRFTSKSTVPLWIFVFIVSKFHNKWKIFLKLQAHENKNALSEMIWPHCVWCADTKLHGSRLSSKKVKVPFLDMHSLALISENCILSTKAEYFTFLLNKAYFLNSIYIEFSWCSGYHICLTHRRSPVQSRAKTCYFCFIMFEIWI